MTEDQTFVVATNTVLERLGKEIAGLLRVYLRNDYSIFLEPDSQFALEEIGIALQSLVGVEVARSIMQEIRQECIDLKSLQDLGIKHKKRASPFWGK